MRLATVYGHQGGMVRRRHSEREMGLQPDGWFLHMSPGALVDLHQEVISRVQTYRNHPGKLRNRVHPHALSPWGTSLCASGGRLTVDLVMCSRDSRMKSFCHFSCKTSGTLRTACRTWKSRNLCRLEIWRTEVMSDHGSDSTGDAKENTAGVCKEAGGRGTSGHIHLAILRVYTRLVLTLSLTYRPERKTSLSLFSVNSCGI